MRRFVVILMMLLMALLLGGDINIIGKVVEKNAVFINLETISYFHFVVLYHCGVELVYLMLICSCLAFIGWLIQLKKPIKPALVRHLTSLSLLLHLFYIFVVLSVIPLILMKSANVDPDYLPTAGHAIVFLFNFLGYHRVIVGSALLCGIILLLTFFPLLHCRLAKKESGVSAKLQSQ
ncbi:MAG TPA: hypothetical protein VN030_01965 [Cellvibrio sp.]|nr:hypothetical protein [Cellvibrio sp.]